MSENANIKEKLLTALQTHWPTALLAAILLLWMRPILFLGDEWWVSHMTIGDLQRAVAVADAWRAGIWDARWFPSFDYGYGYPFLSFYAPLFHWLSGAGLLLFPATVAVRLNVFCWLALGTAGMYLAGERVWDFLSKGRAAPLRPGLLCAIGWLMSPYPMCNVFVRGALAEFASSQTLPWVVWGAFGILGREGRWSRRDSRDLWLLVPLLSAGVLSHNFLGLCVMATAALIAPLVVAIRWLGSSTTDCSRRRKEGLPPYVGGYRIRTAAWFAALGAVLLATLFYWLPALAESRFVHVEAVMGGPYNHRHHYVLPSNLLQVTYWDFYLSRPGPNDDMPLHLGIASVAALVSALAGISLFLSSRRRNIRAAAGIAGLLFAVTVAVLMTMRAGAFLWDRISLLQFGQFPWRLLSIPTVGLCLLLPAALVAFNPARRAPAVTAALFLMIACFAASNYLYARVMSKMPVAGFLDPKLWETTQVLTADLDEYGPIWRDRNRPPQWPRGAILGGENIVVQSSRNRPTHLRASVSNPSPQPTSLTIALNYFPGWRGRLEPGGMRLAIAPEPETGFLRVEDVPPGNSQIHVWFGNSPIRSVCKMISALAWLAWAAAALFIAPRR